jgi:O-antigen ligase
MMVLSEAGPPRSRKSVPWVGLLAIGYVILGDSATNYGWWFGSANAIVTGLTAVAMAVGLLFFIRSWGRVGTSLIVGVPQTVRTVVSWPPTLFIVFVLWAAMTLIRHGFSVLGVQQVTVYMIFAVSMVLAGWGVRGVDPSWLLDRMSVATWLVAGVYAGTLLVAGLNANLVYSARSFALVVVVLLGVALSRSGRGRGIGANVLPYLLFVLVVLSLSRTVLVVAEILIVLWWISGRRGWRAVRAAVVTIPIAGLVTFVLISGFGPLHSRFFTGDMHSLSSVTTVSGSPGAPDQGKARMPEVELPAVNLQGRGSMWSTVWDSARAHLWTGQGPGSASRAIQAKYPRLIHPHNDFLRLLHDTGIIGLVLWLSAALLLLLRLFRNFLSSSEPRTASAAWAGMCAFLGIGATMVTDNPIVYSFVMLPLGVLVGAGLRQTPISVEETSASEAQVATRVG